MNNISNRKIEASNEKRTFLFLQGPASPFFSRLACQLIAEGHDIRRINLCPGDALFWSAGYVTNFRGKPTSWPGFIEKFLKIHEITDIILLGDCREYHRVAIQKAKRFNVKVVIIELGYIRPHWLTIERNGMSSLSHFPNKPDEIMSIAEKVDEVEILTPNKKSYFARLALWDVTHRLSNALFFWLYPFYKSHWLNYAIHEYVSWVVKLLRMKNAKVQAEKTIQKLVEEKEKNPFFVYALQMNTDYQIRAHSPYDTQQQTIDEVLKSFKSNADASARIVIKQHPLDNGIVNWRKLVFEKAVELDIIERVFILDGGNLDNILQHSCGLVTINSTVGMSAIAIGIPVITLGAAVFDIDGLTFQGALDDYWKNTESPNPKLAIAFIKALKATVQAQGGFYSDLDMLNGVSTIVTKLLNGSINGAGAYKEMPPRYKQKAKIDLP